MNSTQQPVPESSPPALRHLAGGEDAELAELIEEVRDHNTRRVRSSSTRRLQIKPATGETRHVVVREAGEESSGQRKHPDQSGNTDSDHTALQSFLHAIERLRKSAPAEPTAADASDATDRLRQRLRDYGHAGFSVTGIRITHVRVHDPHARRSRVCAPSIPAAALPEPTGPGGATGDFAGAFTLDPSLLAATPTLALTVRNILGRSRPIVPVYAELDVHVQLNQAPKRWLRSPSGIFLYAEDLEPGDACELRVDTTGLFDRLPCPAGLIQEARLLLWLPRPAERPMPQPHEAAARTLRVA